MQALAQLGGKILDGTNPLSSRAKRDGPGFIDLRTAPAIAEHLVVHRNDGSEDVLLSEHRIAAEAEQRDEHRSRTGGRAKASHGGRGAHGSGP